MKFGFEDEKMILSDLISDKKNLTIFIQNLFNFIQK